ncbi:MAG: polysaccharide deacetylase family protein [Thiothrix sp.]|nr:polysaccharide deacetylase family protein [Thiothrix sp.]HPE61231.1 polysaccharide deacetylase family protein [Thiolinea sp.]
MKKTRWWKTGIWALAGFLGMTTVQAEDCSAVRARYQCQDDTLYPLHLSFDDGPAMETPELLRVLQREHIPATFFVLAGKVDCEQIRVEQCPSDPTAGAPDCEAYRQCLQRREVLAETRRAGFEIGSHSYSHLHYTQVPPEQAQADFIRARTVLEPYLSTNPPLFRLPYGDGWFNRKENNGQVLQMLDQAGFTHIDWQYSAFDWNTDNQQGDKILSNVLEQVCQRRQGGVVLFHDGVPEQMNEGRLFTIRNMAHWIPAMRCVVDFKPLSFFVKNFTEK